MPSSREYVDRSGNSPLARWFDPLDARAAAKARVGNARLEAGNDSNVKSVGGGVLELRIRQRPGSRVYLGRDRNDAIVQLYGGTKSGQQRDIKRACSLWQEHKQQGG